MGAHSTTTSTDLGSLNIVGPHIRILVKAVGGEECRLRAARHVAPRDGVKAGAVQIVHACAVRGGHRDTDAVALGVESATLRLGGDGTVARESKGRVVRHDIVVHGGPFRVGRHARPSTAPVEVRGFAPALDVMAVCVVIRGRGA